MTLRQFSGCTREGEPKGLKACTLRVHAAQWNAGQPSTTRRTPPPRPANSHIVPGQTTPPPAFKSRHSPQRLKPLTSDNVARSGAFALPGVQQRVHGTHNPDRRLCRALTDTAIDYEEPPEQAEEALRWLEAWSRGNVKGPVPHPGALDTHRTAERAPSLTTPGNPSQGSAHRSPGRGPSGVKSLQRRAQALQSAFPAQ